jgi:hypothetical protein
MRNDLTYYQADFPDLSTPHTFYVLEEGFFVP